MDQTDFVRQVAELPGKLTWFLGAGASQSAGLPTAVDLIWDLKRFYYMSQESQRLSANDLQNPAVRAKIESFMQSRGFPETYDPTAYSKIFELTFGAQMDKQRAYLKRMLADGKVSLTRGYRAFAAMISTGAIKAVFTTNFDSVVEKAVAEVAGKNIAPFHLEGTYAALDALNNDEFPIYCKLHGDFQYQSLKNLATDLATQDAQLGKCLVAACNRFGLVVAGYSGRDESIMRLLHDGLNGQNPFPHGLYWLGLKGRDPMPAVQALIDAAKAKRVQAEYVQIETFDAILTRIWKMLKVDPTLDAKVRRGDIERVSIPLPSLGQVKPVLRLNALPVVGMPTECQELTFEIDKEWHEIIDAEQRSHGKIVCTKGSSILAWGDESSLRTAFSDLKSVTNVSIAERIRDLANDLHLKGFLERTLCLALQQGKPLVARKWHDGMALIIRHDVKPSDLVVKGLRSCLEGPVTGDILGLKTIPSDEYPESVQVSWAEALRIDLEAINEQFWLVLTPDIWIWPRHGRELATEFISRRKGGRFNAKADRLLTEWINLLLPGDQATAIEISPFAGPEGAAHPCFRINRRTAYSRKVGA